MNTSSSRTGFTLVEIMIVVAIIGLLAAIGMPAMLRSGKKSRITRIASEFRTASNAFVMYSLDHGDYPADKFPGIMPDGMADYLSSFPWTEKTTIGGRWDWENGVFGIKAAVSVESSNWGDDLMVQVDQKIDDGNLSTGVFRKNSGRYMYVIEELP